jgi:hypothetical protein
MNETIWRWQARIGSLKQYTAVGALLAGIGLLTLVPNLWKAVNDPSELQVVKIGQLVRREIGADRYVTVSGLAAYGLSYQETKNNNIVAEFYALIDKETGDMVFVRLPRPIPDADKDAVKLVTISGLTHNAPYDLKKLIEADLPDIRKAGLTTTSALYLGEGEKPFAISDVFPQMIGLGLVLLLCVVTLPFPSIVFRPHPLETVGISTIGEPGVKATGRFQRLQSFEPTIQVGQDTFDFKEAVANIVPLEDRRLMMYIHHILTKYGTTFGREETDWALFLDPAHVRDIEPGKLYGWHDRWAVQVRYKDEEDEVQSLIVSFNHAVAQADFVNLLSQMGFAVGTGYAVVD